MSQPSYALLLSSLVLCVPLASVLTRTRALQNNKIDFSLPPSRDLALQCSCPLVYHALISRCPSKWAPLFPRSSLFLVLNYFLAPLPPAILSPSSWRCFPTHGFLALSSDSPSSLFPDRFRRCPSLTRSFPRAFPICLSFPLVSPFSLLPYPFSSVDLSSARDFTSHARAVRASDIACDMIHLFAAFFNTLSSCNLLPTFVRLIENFSFTRD